MNGMKKEMLKDRLREALELRKMRAADLSEKTGVPKGALSYYLAGKSEPKSDRLYQLALALDVSEAWLLGYDVDRERTVEQKKNDQLAALVVRLRREPDLLDAVLCLSELPPEQFAAAKALLLALRK